MPDNIFKKIAEYPQVEAIALGGSRAGTDYDEKSDYDVYVYCTEPLTEKIRREVLAAECSYMEIGNHFWEYEDNCTLNNGVDIDIIYRRLDEFIAGISQVADKYQAANGYTTCMWHNLITCKILYDKDGRLEAYQRKYSIPYPEELRHNIIQRNMKLMKYAMPAYITQIDKAARRRDLVSVNHRAAEFLASYFDVIFALNKLSHPGEKRLIEICKSRCEILPADFEKNLNFLLKNINQEQVVSDLAEGMVNELEKILS